MKDNPVRSLVLATGLGTILGLVLGLFFSKACGLSFSGSVTAGNIFQASATVGSAFLVTLYLQRLVTLQRKQKDLLLQQFDLLLSLLSDFEQMKVDQELIEVNKLLKRISLKNELIKRCMKECRCADSLIERCDIAHQISELRRLATDTPRSDRLEVFAKMGKCPAYVKEGIIHLTSERKSELDLAIEAVKSAVFDAQMSINRL